MRNLTFKKSLLCFLLASIPLFAQAQHWSDSTLTTTNKKTNPSIGLALSGGGAKGFAHIGVLKVFEEEGIPVHMISGTSMGAIVGSLYAIGYSPREIEQIALSTDWNVLFNDSYRINPQNISNSVSNRDTYLFTFPFNGSRLQLPSGLIDGQNVSMMLYRLMLPYHGVQDFTELPIPFVAVATDLSTGEAHTFTHGYLPDAVRASSAIPTIFKPVKIGSKTYIDGGVARNIPVQDARNLGADLVIASDVGEPLKAVDSLNTFVDVLFQSVGFHQKESDIQQQAMTDFYIRPDIEEFSSFSYDHAAAIIERGEKAARKLVPELKSYLQNNLASSNFKSISPRQDTLLIADVSLTNISGLLKQQTSLTLDIQPPSWLTLPDIENKINRLYNSGLFSQISYRLQNQTDVDGDELVLEFQQKQQEYVGFSVRYDSKYKAALLFGATLSDNIFWSDRLTTRLRVGEVLELSSEYSAPISLAPVSEANLGFNIQRSPIDLYNQNQAFGTVQIEQMAIQPSLSVRLFDKVDFKAGVEAEVFNLNEAVGNTLVLENTSLLLNNSLQMVYNTLNRPYFPTRGQSFNLTAEYSDRSLGSSFTYFQAYGTWKSTLPITDGITATNKLFTGYTASGSDVPLHNRFYLGGLAQNPVFKGRQHPFMGYSDQQLSSDNFLAFESKLQVKLSKKIYVTGGWNVAHLSDLWSLNLVPDRIEYGYSLSIGSLTVIGPIELSLATPDLSGGYSLKIDVGYHF